MEMLSIVGIDPGTTKSAVVVVEIIDNEIVIVDHGELENDQMRFKLKDIAQSIPIINHDTCQVVIEDIKSQGMAVGATTFETVKWIGRFIEVATNEEMPVSCIPRYKVKHILCGSTRAKDPHIRQRLIDLIGVQGTKKNPGPLYGVTSHKIQALAVIVAHMIDSCIEPIFNRSLK